MCRLDYSVMLQCFFHAPSHLWGIKWSGWAIALKIVPKMALQLCVPGRCCCGVYRVFCIRQHLRPYSIIVAAGITAGVAVSCGQERPKDSLMGVLNVHHRLRLSYYYEGCQLCIFKTKKKSFGVELFAPVFSALTPPWSGDVPASFSIFDWRTLFVVTMCSCGHSVVKCILGREKSYD